MCVCLFVNITRFDLYSVIFLSFLRVKSGKTHRENPFLRLRVRVWLTCKPKLADQNNGGSNISKRENSELWRDYFRNCAPVSLGEQRILIK